jgi:glycerol kinase
LRDGLGVLGSASESEGLAADLPSNEGVYMVPAFVGLGAPYWEAEARGTIVGLTRGTRRAHLARAALEAMAYSTLDVLRAMESDSGLLARELRVDGGATRNDWLTQFIAHILSVPVLRPANVETTALGATGLAGLATGVWSEPEEFMEAVGRGRRFEPGMAVEARREAIAGWRGAVQATLAAVAHDEDP